MKIAINGFGRIGRLLLRQLATHPEITVVAINDLGSLRNLAYLTQYDTAHKGYADVSYDEARSVLIVGGKEIQFFSKKDPMELPWKDLGIDCVIEATGVFESFEKAQVHIAAGAKRVLLTAPAKDADGEFGKTILIGINEDTLSSCVVSSNASCTTNAVSPVIAVLSEKLGIVKAILNTVHAYTATQSIVDGPVKGNDLRRGRAAAQNIVPSTTGAALAVTRVLPQLTGKFDGVAMRVPVVSGSLIDLTFVASRSTSVEEVNAILKEASESPRWKGILAFSTDPLVSSDIVGMPFGSIVDAEFTKVIDGDLVKVLAWYDNEAGYVSTLVRHLEQINSLVK